MPASYAHYRFGGTAAAALSGEAAKAVRHFRQLFDVGTHGPDLFFYFNPLMHTKIGSLGKTFHCQSGKVFFENAVRVYREAPSEGSLSYLMGLLSHYALDSLCHPLVCAVAEEGKIGHTELETEFDRYLLTLDGKTPACTYDVSRHMRLTRGECATAAAFFEPASAFAVGMCVRHMAWVNHTLTWKKRDRLEKLFRIAGPHASQMVMLQHPNHNCLHLDEPLMAQYEKAQERYTVLAAQLLAYMQNDTPLGEEFAPTF